MPSADNLIKGIPCTQDDERKRGGPLLFLVQKNIYIFKEDCFRYSSGTFS